MFFDRFFCNLNRRRQMDTRDVLKVSRRYLWPFMGYWENPKGGGQNLPPAGRGLTAGSCAGLRPFGPMFWHLWLDCPGSHIAGWPEKRANCRFLIFFWLLSFWQSLFSYFQPTPIQLWKGLFKTVIQRNEGGDNRRNAEVHFDNEVSMNNTLRTTHWRIITTVQHIAGCELPAWSNMWQSRCHIYIG